MLPVCGRPLDLQLVKPDQLLVADGYKGLNLINTTTGEKELLFDTNTSDDINCKIFTNFVVLSNGSIFFSCMSINYGIHELVAEPSPLAEFLFNPSQNNDYGLLLHYNPTTKQTVIVEGPHILIANGVAVSPNEEFIIVAEMGRRAINR